MRPNRPGVLATRHLVVSGHYLASQAGFQILEAGGNAIDAGVAVGLAINVLESEMTGFGGVAPSMLRLGDSGETIVFIGVGPWPQTLDSEYFRRQHDGRVPPGILESVVPAAPDIWMTALERYGTLSFSDVAEAAIRFAREGFAMYPLMAEVLREHLTDFQDLPSTAAIFCPDGRLPRVAERFVQSDLAGTLQFLCDEERAAAGRGRAAGIAAARAAFYEGDIAKAIVAQQEDEGGFLTREDLSTFQAETEAPARGRFGDYELYGCGPWSQGPMILQAAQVLDGLGLPDMAHNQAEYVHAVVEALKLSAADREAYYGDPAKVNVPLDRLLSLEYADERRCEIDSTGAHPGLPDPGTAGVTQPPPWQPDPTSRSHEPAPPRSVSGSSTTPLETSYFCVMDGQGNLFSSTPSDPTISGAVVPGTGITTSRWGSRAHTDPRHPARVGPGWRPRMSANPMLAVRPGKVMLPLGSPGSEVLGQAQLQVLLNMLCFGMDPQSAVEMPRFASESWPASAIPHRFHPARLKLEAPIGEKVGADLQRLGHDVQWWPERAWRAGSVCTIRADLETGVMEAGADPRRTAYAIGW